VTVEIKGWVESGDVFEELHLTELTLGDELLVRGLWKSIEHMAKQEKAKIKILVGD